MPLKVTKLPLFLDVLPSYFPLNQTINYYRTISESKIFKPFTEGAESQRVNVVRKSRKKNGRDTKEKWWSRTGGLAERTESDLSARAGLSSMAPVLCTATSASRLPWVGSLCRLSREPLQKVSEP